MPVPPRNVIRRIICVRALGKNEFAERYVFYFLGAIAFERAESVESTCRRGERVVRIQDLYALVREVVQAARR